MRIYEFSKKYNIPTKELLESLHEAGFVVKSHMSVIDDSMIAFLNEKFVQQKQKDHQEEQSTQIRKASLQVTTQPSPVNHATQEVKKTVQKNILKEEKPKRLVIAPMQVAEFAEKTGQSISDVILTLLKSGIMANKNQILTESAVRSLADHYKCEIVQKEVVVDAVTSVNKPTDATDASLQKRLPIVVVLGHVDHGKTTLLDLIRKTRVAAREKGGITQHLGAYEAKTPQGNIVFLDTPGHEAFPKIRQRGIRVADIVVLVVAADDGIMPQTVEAIKQAKSMNVPIIVAVNKIDKVDSSRIDIIKQQLSQHDLLTEDWGGEVVCVPISAKVGTGIDTLLEMIWLQAELMELRANFKGEARGYLLESRLEKGYGPVATLICQHGKISVGDYFICGDTAGKVTALVSSSGEKVQSVGPSVPVQVAGFDTLPHAGDFFEKTDKETYLHKRSIAKELQHSAATQRIAQQGAVNLIVKADNNSSQEALLDAIAKLSKKGDKGFNIIYSGIGDISESDVELAYNTASILLGLHIKSETNAHSLAQQRKIDVRLFDIIYKCLEDIETLTKKPAEVIKERKNIGQATVLRVFDIKNVGVIAGCYVRDGRFVQNGLAVISRKNQKIGEGKILSLQRDKKKVKEVYSGFECAFIVDGFNEWAVDDIVECYIEEIKR